MMRHQAMLAPAYSGGVWSLRYYPHLGSHQGRVGHRGRSSWLEPGLSPAKAARLVAPQGERPSKRVFSYLVATRIGFEPTISGLTGQYVNRYTTGPEWLEGADVLPVLEFMTSIISVSRRPNALNHQP